MAYWGLLAILFMIYIEPTEWVPLLVGLPIELPLLAATTLMAVVEHRRSRMGPRLMHALWLVLWLGMILISNVSAQQTLFGIGQVILYSKRVVLPFTIWLVLDSVERVRGVLLLMLVLSGVMGVQGLYQIRNGVGWAGQHLNWLDRIQWIGLWDGPNVLSLLFVTGLAFALEVLFGVRWGKIWKVVAVISGAYMLVGLYLANSRGGWLAFGVVLMAYFYRRIGRWGLALGALGGAAALALGPSRLVEINAQESSAAGRVEMWAYGIDMLKDAPLFGIGKGRFAIESGSLLAHNTFIQNAGETGMAGLFVFVALLYASFKSFAALERHQALVRPETLSTSRAAFVALVGYLAAAFFVSADFDLLYVLMGLSAAMVTIAWRDSNGSLPRKSVTIGGRDLRNIAILEVGGVVFLYVVTRALG